MFTSNDFDDFTFQNIQISKINLNGTVNKMVVFPNREYVDDLKLNGNDLFWAESFEII